MVLVVDLSKSKPTLILKEEQKEIAQCQWEGLYYLSETLVPAIDRFLKENKVDLKQVEDVRVVPNKNSLISTRIAKAVALGLGFEGKRG